MIERFSLNPVVKRHQELEILQNSFALDPDSIVPWTQNELFSRDTHKRDDVHFARIAIDGSLSRLTTSPDDIQRVAKLLEYDKLLRRLS
jgi:hypothetical protein